MPGAGCGVDNAELPSLSTSVVRANRAEPVRGGARIRQSVARNAKVRAIAAARRASAALVTARSTPRRPRAPRPRDALLCSCSTCVLAAAPKTACALPRRKLRARCRAENCALAAAPRTARSLPRREPRARCRAESIEENMAPSGRALEAGIALGPSTLGVAYWEQRR